MTTCMNGHEPEHIEVRPNGARVCSKCAAEYAFRIRTHKSNTRKETDRDRHRTR